MTKAESEKPAKPQPRDTERAERLKANLRANLLRRKAQARARTEDAKEKPESEDQA